MIERNEVGLDGVNHGRSAFADFSPETPASLIVLLMLSEYTGAYKKLPEETRQALELRHVGGLNMAEIGRELGLSQSVVSRRLSFAPYNLWKIMIEDAQNHRLNVPVASVVRAYSAYQEDLQSRGERMSKPSRRKYWSSHPES
jgi:hypothetical protein